MPIKINSNDQITNIQDEFDSPTNQSTIHINMKNDGSRTVVQDTFVIVGAGFVQEGHGSQVTTETQHQSTGTSSITLDTGEVFTGHFATHIGPKILNNVNVNRTPEGNEVIHQHIRLSDFDL